MRILHIIPSIGGLRGGPSQVVLETVKSLCINGIDAEIATTNDNGSDLLDVNLLEKISYQEVPVWVFPRFSPSFNSIREFAFSYQLTTWLWKNVSNYDLLHVYSIFSYPSAIAMEIANFKKVPYIATPFGQLCQWSLGQSRLKKQIYLVVVGKKHINNSEALYLTSEKERQELTYPYLKTCNFILPHGISISDRISEARVKLRTKLKLAEDEPIILFLSRIHPKKGLDLLIPALEKIRDRQFTFILAGNSDRIYETEVDNLLQRHNLNSRTIKTGFVSGEYKNLLLQGADLFALTSYSENFGVAVLEALAAGTPALSTPEVALSSLVEKENFGYVTKLDINAVVSNLEYILDNPQEAKEKGDRASEFIRENYSWDKIALKMIDVYEKILDE